MERLGIRTKDRAMLWPHSCRYMLATRSHSMGIDNDMLAKILGHAEFAVTSDIYIQADLQHLHQEKDKIDPGKKTTNKRPNRKTEKIKNPRTNCRTPIRK